MDKGTSYRPIWLLSVIAKILEKSIFPYITGSIPNTPTQNGYKTATLYNDGTTHIKHHCSKGVQPNGEHVALDMNKALDTIHTVFVWTKQNNPTLNPDKTTCTLFTPDHAEYKSNQDLKINNTALPMATHPKVLGITLDPKLTYSTHIHNISVQAHKSLHMIKALTATEWGKQNETLMATYKSVMRPTLEYASSI